MKRPKQLEFDLGKDWGPRKPSYHEVVWKLYKCGSEMHDLWMRFMDTITKRQCYEIRKGVFKSEDWEDVRAVLKDLEQMEKRIYKIHAFLDKHGFDMLEGVIEYLTERALDE